MGRTAELELFRGALEDPEAFSVLFVHGPGGVGKTALLAAFWRSGGGRRPGPGSPRPAVDRAVSARGSPRRWRRRWGCPPARAPQDALAARRRPVLLLDTFEQAVGLEDWLRERFVPALPAGALVVVAGRARPGEGWRRDPGWRDLLRVVSLRNLVPEDARAIAGPASGVPEDRRDRSVELTHGHPLALWLMVEVLSQRGEEGDGPPLELEAVPDVVRARWRRASSPRPRGRATGWHWRSRRRRGSRPRSLMRAALDDAEDAGELFAWLCELLVRGERRVRGVPARPGA